MMGNLVKMQMSNEIEGTCIDISYDKHVLHHSRTIASTTIWYDEPRSLHPCTSYVMEYRGYYIRGELAILQAGVRSVPVFFLLYSHTISNFFFKINSLEGIGIHILR